MATLIYKTCMVNLKAVLTKFFHGSLQKLLGKISGNISFVTWMTLRPSIKNAWRLVAVPITMLADGG